MPRFANVSCSQCGKEFGPGEHGFSSCEDHAPGKIVEVLEPTFELGVMPHWGWDPRNDDASAIALASIAISLKRIADGLHDALLDERP